MKQCPRCHSERIRKAGKTKGRQRYLCKTCGFHSTVIQKSTARSPSLKRMALMMYLEGIGFNAIGRALKVSHVAVLKWAQQWGKELELIRNFKPAPIIEIAEIRSHIRCKKPSYDMGILWMRSKKKSWMSSLVVKNRKMKENFIKNKPSSWKYLK